MTAVIRLHERTDAEQLPRGQLLLASGGPLDRHSTAEHSKDAVPRILVLKQQLAGSKFADGDTTRQGLNRVKRCDLHRQVLAHGQPRASE